MRRWITAAAVSLVAGIAVLAPPSAEAASPYLVMPPKAEVEASPAYRYANMSGDEALAELDRRGVPYVRVKKMHGVRTPVRLTGPLHGVRIHSVLPEPQRAASVFEILDARFALALDDFAALLERHDIVEVVHYTMYRPNGPKPGSPEAKEYERRRRAKERAAKRGGRPSLGKASKPSKGRKPRVGKSRPKRKATPWEAQAAKFKPWAEAFTPHADKAKPRPKGKRAYKPIRKKLWSPPGTRHPAGLAIDVGSLRKADGRWLRVAQHFRGHLGAPTCGPGVRVPTSPEARELRSIVCEARDLGLFTYVLTPNYDRAHADHYHMEIRADVRWFLYH